MIRRRACWFRLGICLTALGWFFADRLARAEHQHVIICGSGGEDEYRDRFVDWGMRLRRVLTTEFAYAEDQVQWLTEAADAASSTVTTTNLDSIRSALMAASARLTPRDNLFIYLIGHGSYLRDDSKFHIPGPDLTAAQLSEMLKAISARHVVVIDATSGSAGFINVLSGPGRIICTATKSTEEMNATRFMEGFLQGIENGSADRDRDERISILEACSRAASLTAEAYKGDGLIATEHALIDDNGDGLGSRLPIGLAGGANPQPTSPSNAIDGALASTCYLKDFSFPPSAPKELVDRYLTLLGRIAALKLEKSGIKKDEYLKRLETLLIDAARANREIHRLSQLAEPSS